jgi:hypothetical protein
MYVSGFTFIRNAIQFDFPIVEAIKSILPLCDEVVVAVGTSDDATLALIQSIVDPRIRIIQTTWDDSLRDGGRVLAIETNKAFDAVNPNADWCIYIQGDEIVHEQDYIALRSSMQLALSQPEIEGLLFDYTHFYGSYDYIGTSRRWYRKEVRIIRNNKSIRSWQDAQGFRWSDGRKLRVAHSGGRVFHYGWVKHPKQQQAKQLNFNELWHDKVWIAEHVGKKETYAYNDTQPLKRFDGVHPSMMHERIKNVNWSFETDPTRVQISLKERLSQSIEQWTGWRIGEYRNYILL